LAELGRVEPHQRLGGRGEAGVGRGLAQRRAEDLLAEAQPGGRPAADRDIAGRVLEPVDDPAQKAGGAEPVGRVALDLGETGVAAVGDQLIEARAIADRRIIGQQLGIGEAGRRDLAEQCAPAAVDRVLGRLAAQLPHRAERVDGLDPALAKARIDLLECLMLPVDLVETPIGPGGVLLGAEADFLEKAQRRRRRRRRPADQPRLVERDVAIGVLQLRHQRATVGVDGRATLAPLIAVAGEVRR
jgi:hypothetical protein